MLDPGALPGRAQHRGKEEDVVRGHRRGSPVRGSGIGAFRPLAAGFGLVLLLAFAPSSLGSHLPRTVVAPYTGSTAHSGKYLDAYCGVASGARTTWNSTSGVVLGGSRGSFRSCSYAGYGTYATGEATHSSNVSIPFTVSKTGRYNVTETFNWSARSAESVTPGKCRPAANIPNGYDYNSCVWYVQWYVYVDTYLWDQTSLSVASPVDNGYWVSNSTEGYTDNYCSYGTCGTSTATYNGTGAYDYSYQAPGSDYEDLYVPSGTNSGSGSLWTNSTSWNASAHTGTNDSLVPGDSYELVSSVYFIAFAESYGYSNIYTGSMHLYPVFDPKGSGSTSVSGSVTLTSVTITQVV